MEFTSEEFTASWNTTSNEVTSEVLRARGWPEVPPDGWRGTMIDYVEWLTSRHPEWARNGKQLGPRIERVEINPSDLEAEVEIAQRAAELASKAVLTLSSLANADSNTMLMDAIEAARLAADRATTLYHDAQTAAHEALFLLSNQSRHLPGPALSRTVDRYLAELGTSLRLLRDKVNATLDTAEVAEFVANEQSKAPEYAGKARRVDALLKALESARKGLRDELGYDHDESVNFTDEYWLLRKKRPEELLPMDPDSKNGNHGPEYQSKKNREFKKRLDLVKASPDIRAFRGKAALAAWQAVFRTAKGK